MFKVVNDILLEIRELLNWSTAAKRAEEQSAVEMQRVLVILTDERERYHKRWMQH